MEDTGTVAVHCAISNIANKRNGEPESQLYFILPVMEPVQTSFMNILAPAGILKFG